MVKVVLIGSGNVAQHLIRAFQTSNILSSSIELVQVYARKKETLTSLLDSSKITDDWQTLKEADVYIIAVSDDAISWVSEQLPFENRLVIHTSGSVAMASLNSKNRKGIFYPLQTFSKDKSVDFTTIPICLEAQNQNDYQTLEQLAKSISNSVFEINSDQRKALHVAAVFVNNFTNHLYQIGEEICQEHQVPFEILKPLIKETAEKVMGLSPENAQTGPAKRNDILTLEAHKSFLSNENQKNIYTILTQSIQDHVKKL